MNKRLSLAIAGAAALGLMAAPLASANPIGGAEAICTLQGGNLDVGDSSYTCKGNPFFEDVTKGQVGAKTICTKALKGSLFDAAKAQYSCLGIGGG